MERIIFTGDIQRPNSNQVKNIEWLYRLKRHTFDNVLCEVFTVADKLSEEDWFKTFTDMEMPFPLFEHYGEALKEFIVVGFEMPPNAIYQLENKGIKYINYIIYPVRYMPDLVIGYKSNFYSEDAVKEQDFFICADVIISHFDLLITRTDIPENTCLVIGQTEQDGVLINGGKIQEIDFNTLPKDKHLFFKPHPFGKEKSVPVPVINGNIYELLSNPKITMVAGINSSVLYEAKYFGKQVIRQGRDWAKDYIPISAKCFLGMDMPENTLRWSCNVWWGYKEIREGI